MSALHDALLHPANRPGELVRRLAGMVNPGADLRELQDGGGTICDFRPDCPDTDPSLSVSLGSMGAVFKRFGGDGFQGGALDFVASCLHVSKGEAARLLIDWAGVMDTGAAKGSGRPSPKAVAGAVKLLGRVRDLKPLEEEDRAGRLKGWVRIEAGEDSPEAGELARRGLSLALTSGLLTAYRFTGRYGPDGGPQKVRTLPGHILPGALAFEVRGPDAQPWAYKVRNPGSKAELEAAGKNRYAYIGKGQGTPAWCSPDLTGAQAELWIEGELSGAAVAVMLEAAGYLGAVGVQGLAGSESLPHVAQLGAGREVYIYADPDPAGDRARQTWASLAAHCGAKVYQLPRDLFGAGDACELLPTGSAEDLGRKVMRAVQDAEEWTPPQAEISGAAVVWTGKKSGYKIDGGKLCAFTVKEEDGEEWESLEVLTNFSAHITAEVTLEDGTGEAGRVFEIEGQRADGRLMNPARVSVTAAEFPAMNWPVAKWGAGAVVHAGQGKKDKARVAMQLLSEARGMAERTVYHFTGWIEHPEHGPCYLTAGAVIGAAGAVEGVDVELTGRLAGYALPDPASGEEEAMQDAVRASLALLELAPDSVSVPVLGAVYRAPLGRLNAAVWLTGSTGLNKTALLALAQSHYGPTWNAEHLPDGWNSSANALERGAFMVKDAVFLIDDFKPGGSKTDTDRAHGNAARVLQGVADGAGRATLTADRKSRAGLYPRGTVMSSAETLPRGHSNRARAVLVDVRKPLIDSPAKSRAFYAAADLGASGVYALALAGYVQTLAGHLDEVKAGSEAHRASTRHLAPRFEGQHGRTGPAAAELAYGWQAFLSFAVMVEAVTEQHARHIWARVVAALEETAAGQGEHLTDEDPINRALSVLSGLLSQGRVYLEDLEDGGAPSLPEAAGWQRRTFVAAGGEGEEFMLKPGALLLGYVSKSGGDAWAYFLPDALHEALQRAVSAQGGAMLPDQGQLWATMRDKFHPAGLMRCQVGSGRTRPTWQVSVKGKRERLLTLRFPIEPDRFRLGAVGELGAEGHSRTSGMAPSTAPILSLFTFQVGAVGSESTPASSFAAAAVLPMPINAEMAAGPDAWAVTV